VLNRIAPGKAILWSSRESPRKARKSENSQVNDNTGDEIESEAATWNIRPLLRRPFEAFPWPAVREGRGPSRPGRKARRPPVRKERAGRRPFWDGAELAAVRRSESEHERTRAEEEQEKAGRPEVNLGVSKGRAKGPGAGLPHSCDWRGQLLFGDTGEVAEKGDAGE